MHLLNLDLLLLVRGHLVPSGRRWAPLLEPLKALSRLGLPWGSCFGFSVKLDMKSERFPWVLVPPAAEPRKGRRYRTQYCIVGTVRSTIHRQTLTDL